MKDVLKDKILVFIIGLLVGAIIATGCYYCYSKSHTNNNHTDRPNMMSQDGNFKGMKGGTPPSMPSNNQNGNSNQNDNQGQPPAMPEQNSNTDPPTTNGNT